ncbi:MAG: 3-isopropylmalate dehydratase small subunit [Terriglobia bacterium]
MEPFTRLNGVVAPLDMPNVDTDQIIPKQFLKRIERTGFGQYLFYDWRLIDGKQPNPDFELNQERYRGASILLTRANFGCGSSREHAPWALQDFGFRSVLAPSFADIFYNNCFKNGMLPIRLEEAKIQTLFEKVRSLAGFSLQIDLETCRVRSQDGIDWKFEVDEFRRHCLLHGLDDIGLTLQHQDRIQQYENAHPVVVAG